MMSSIKRISFQKAVKRQFSFKLKAYHNIIGSLFLFQIIALFFSIGGNSSSMIDSYLAITNYTYSADIIVTFTLLWIFTVSFYMTNRASKNMMFNFVTDKFSNHVANMLCMLFFSAIGAVSAVLLGVAVRLGMIFYVGIDDIYMYETMSITGLIVILFVVFLYHVLVFSFGYIIGEIIQLHRTFVLIVPLFLFGLFIFTVNVFNEAYLFTFYMMESNLFIFTIKVIGSVMLFWLIAIQVGKRLEVRLP